MFTNKDPKAVCYPREELLRLRQIYGIGGGAFQIQLPSLLSYPTAELDQLLITSAEAGQLPPRSWHRCSDRAKRAALLAVLRAGHMHAVFAMQPQSQHFRAELGCEPADVTFLNEAMVALCADAAAGSRIPLAEPVRWLLEQGAPVVPLLPCVRVSACLGGLTILRDMHTLSEEAAEAVLSLLHHKDPRVRLSAAETLSSTVEASATTRLVPVLAKHLFDNDARVRAAVACSLGQLGDSGVAAAGDLVNHHDPEIRGLAAQALGSAGAGAAAYVPVLVSWLGTEEMAPLRAAAASALGSIGEVAGAAVAAVLAERLQFDGDCQVREAAATALGRLGEKAAEYVFAIVAALEDTDPFVQAAAEAAAESISRSS